MLLKVSNSVQVWSPQKGELCSEAFFFLNASKSLTRQGILLSKETAAMESDLENTRQVSSWKVS